ncbi:nucleotidyl transferase AbiEii/AbiGii toxin family protein [Streptomyces guryensis]|uniref:Nucleotidyl transferase AbiEii/AbiGii toxin family protein n=1 Tax=Streptomyces guryensis TaxID=2886947 RepID=A0A9Q3VSZ3_9ACTN|nr:nucleotidyl transferase AbiEii/AbiGii toxin family protein [Streptomyces guryensis]MCD9876833.1 nucleotidyl transferase AbiEii/AbiGii toxin family protein [Streptomyces guryensis]
MNLTDLQSRLLTDVLAVGTPYPLVLTGDCAVQAHGLVDHLSQVLEVATEHPEDMERIRTVVRAGLEERGWRVRALETDPLSAQLIVSDPDSGDECEVDVLKEVMWRPPVRTEYGLALSLEDVVGTKVWALADRGLPRDLIDVRAAADRWTHPELEELGRRHARDTFDLSDLQTRLTGTDWLGDSEFAACGLDADAITGLRQWAQTWADDIAERLLEGEPPEDE